MKNSKRTLETLRITCCYFSKNKRESLLDMQIFFPFFSKVEKSFNIHIPSDDTMIRLKEEMSSFQDVCLLNSTMISSQALNTLSAPQIEMAFREHPLLNSHSQIKKTLLLSEHSGVSTTISWKRSLNRSQADHSNLQIYKISEPELADELTSIFFGKSERNYKLNIVVLRPWVVTNKLDELFLNVYRTNGFTIVHRVYKLLSDYEIQYLAKLEDVEEMCYETYHELMTQGMVLSRLSFRSPSSSWATIQASRYPTSWHRAMSISKHRASMY
jgi:hypothetical protein